MIVHRRILSALPAVAMAMAVATTAYAQVTGPSSSASPYVIPSLPHVAVQSVLTAADSVPRTGGGSYRLVGHPDGAGAFDNGDGTLTLLLNHELGTSAGVVREHGSRGAFVSKWVIDEATREVLSGEDLIQAVALWDTAGAQYVITTDALCGFCSATLAPTTAFYDSASGLGTAERIFTNGEECGVEGRAFAHVVTGTDAGISWELPRVGKGSWENVAPCPVPQGLTILIGTEDRPHGEVYVYVGTKQGTGSAIERAGLTNGTLYGVVVDGVPLEDRLTGIGGASGTFSMHDLGDVSAWSGADLEARSDSASVTEFLRPEDGGWDPEMPGDFYFATTDRFDQTKDGIGSQIGRTRLWRLRFADIADPALGGTIEMLLDGTEPGTNMLDNLTTDAFGHLLIQEDPGNARREARIWNYDVASDSLVEVARADSARFGNLTRFPSAPFNRNEETTGIIDVSDLLGSGWFLLAVQAHYTIGDVEIDEGGQLLSLYSHASAPDRMTLDPPGPGIAGQPNTLVATGVTPGESVYFIYGFGFGAAPVPGCGALSAEIESPRIAAVATADPGGRAEVTVAVPPAANRIPILIQAVDPAGCLLSNPVAFQFE